MEEEPINEVDEAENRFKELEIKNKEEVEKVFTNYKLNHGFDNE